MKPRLAFALVLAASSAIVSACRGPDGQAAPTDPFAGDASSAAGGAGGLSSSSAGITGTIHGPAGACPALSFTLEGKTIRTVAATRYDGLACKDIKEGVRVTIMGPTTADASVQAEKVTLVAAAAAPSSTTTGTVSDLAGSCPALSFKLERKTVTTTLATGYERGACGDVRNAVRVTVTGTAQTETSILAQKIAFIR